MKFRFVKGPTSDIKFEACGRDAGELFENAALAVSSVMCEVKRVRPSRCVEVEVEGKNLHDLLFDWLNRVIALVDIECMFFSRFEVKVRGNRLKARCFGEDANPGNSLTVVKSVTYHEFALEKTAEGYRAAVVLDI